MIKRFTIGRARCLGFLLAALLTLSAELAADTIALPDKLPELNATETTQLGTLEKGFGLIPGRKVDNLSLLNQFGKKTSLNTLLAKQPVLIVFYRGGWCPYCNRQIYELTQAWPEFEQRKVTPVLISADKPEASALASRTYDIPFPVLSDPKLIAHQQFKVAMTLDAATLKKYQEYGIDLAEWSGESHASFAVSSAFLLDQTGTVMWSHSSLDYAKRPSVDQLLGVIDTLW